MDIKPTVGIDISKDKLDAYRLNDGQRIEASNDKADHQAVIKWLGREEVALVIFEATGAYHVLLENAA